MRWMITDSGMGGLSVCAGLEQALQGDAGSGIELLYVNATPHDLSGYNSLKTQAERIDLFNRFLIAAYARFSPDEIAIACNTLSVIYHETDFSKQCPVKTKGIVEAGVKLCTESLAREPDNKLVIFATETTTEANTYPHLINTKSSRLVAQACPGLAHAISNDASGADCRNLLESYVPTALKRFDHLPQTLLAFLGCTHYGYQAHLFREILEAYGLQVKILNPNDLLVHELISDTTLKQRNSKTDLNVRFISRYTIPQDEIDSMEYYLTDAAPLTLDALRNQEVIPNLFETS